jgi:hypothetical protein
VINQSELDLLAEIGIVVKEIQTTQDAATVRFAQMGVYHPLADQYGILTETNGTFIIDNARFTPSMHLLHITNMIIKSQNPAVQEMFGQLVSLLHLTQRQ